MLRSLFSGVSGLKNHNTRMDVIGNNIANVNTTGFKASRVIFEDMLSQTSSGASSPRGNIGGTNPKQVGLGVATASIDLLFKDGSVQGTGKNTDLALSGDALFVVNRGSERFYTRNGAFEFDADGNYVLPGSGLFVQGWTAKDGVLNTSGSTGNITIESGKSMVAAATKAATYTNNLNGSTTRIAKLANTASGIVSAPGTIVTASSSDPVTITMSDGTVTTVTEGKFEVGHSLPVTTTVRMYDTLGTAHEIPIYFTLTKLGSGATTSDGNQWTVNVNGGDVTGNTATINEADGSTTTVTLTPVTLQFSTSGALISGGGTVTLTLTNGSFGSQNVTLDLSAVTQYAGTSTIVGKADGNAAGTLSSLTFDNSGTITGTYSNGVRQVEAQVALAQFNNSTGLTKMDGSLYQESNNSGVANVKTASDLGVTITPSSLEMSNVDIADQFSDMIVTQRGFQSNSKIITVGDEMLETLINMKR